MKSRCFWVSDSKLYQEYHDNEWGQPVYDDETLFEFLVLETFQAGLSWITILNKRENFRKAFNNFDYEKIAKYTESKYLSLLQDAGIIRNKLKIKSAIANAQLFMQVQEEFGSFSKFIWSYVEGKPIINKFHKREEVPATTELSDKISKDLKKRGFKFVGSTVIYAYMQAVGMVNDHTTECYKYPK
ncbi:MAG: DNA-3-methyladenine glycosylase I [Polaribacter sp.]|jgi:DNA-3-methyladenine glycosylase I|uniref:DNA-3-methyladenine glycosylase I n=1 Tax=Polaribacter sp. Hel1_33_96 TaxID=1336805 RepID=UPI000C701F60|nr:DNA-3-methyladenine glycosylase I [Polaribacter sp. Hel1_33_96]MBT3742981.1 DNA-3-methyladenine glycosylase I [Polaribacter sp.]MBT4412638.1 DNA-3-methyladenine glycosylase I [Polaribacter sp.]PKV64092.1 DNA-3-methyladenine glycosylase I [Polaribacter sp. Hel1_33_96]